MPSVDIYSIDYYVIDLSSERTRWLVQTELQLMTVFKYQLHFWWIVSVWSIKNVPWVEVTSISEAATSTRLLFSLVEWLVIKSEVNFCSIGLMIAALVKHWGLHVYPSTLKLMFPVLFMSSAKSSSLSQVKPQTAASLFDLPSLLIVLSLSAVLAFILLNRTTSELHSPADETFIITLSDPVSDITWTLISKVEGRQTNNVFPRLNLTIFNSRMRPLLPPE